MGEADIEPALGAWAERMPGLTAVGLRPEVLLYCSDKRRVVLARHDLSPLSELLPMVPRCATTRIGLNPRGLVLLQVTEHERHVISVKVVVNAV